MVTLESSKLFSQLPEAEIKMMRQHAKEMSFAPGQDIFKEGDPGDGVYVVKAGRVEISAAITSGERHVFSQVLPGDVFGEMAVLDCLPRSACASAQGDTTVYFVPRDYLVEVLKHSPELSMSMVQEISRRLREFNRQFIRKVLQVERLALIGRFSSSIVHDLKNPLTIISIATEQACAGDSTPGTRDVAQGRIGKQVERITTLVNDILEFTRGTSLAMTFSELNYATFVESIINEFRDEVALKGVRIELENQPPAIKLPLNPQRLSRVFFNLIHNAVDEMPGGGTIKLRFKTSDREVITEIEDNGGGIAPEIVDHLFEAFASFGKPTGTGLGLSITQRIIEEHLGTISARNHPGTGAVFAFTLPLKR